MQVIKTNFRFANKSTNPNPEFATLGSSGFDLRANLESPLIILPANRHVIPTGLYFELPPNYEIQVRSRSGLAAKNGIAVLNSPGTVDEDYRGEIKVILINHGDTQFIVNHGDRIAQAVIAETVDKSKINLQQIADVSTDTVRSNGGLGSTGIN